MVNGRILLFYWSSKEESFSCYDRKQLFVPVGYVMMLVN
jgi:hypothetical protein